MTNSKQAAIIFSAVLGAAAAAHGQQNPPSAGFFDWEERVGGAGATAGFTATPFLDNDPARVANTRVQLAAAKAAGQVLAVKVVGPITTAAAKQVFSDFAVQYVFADFEGINSTNPSASTKAIADVLTSSTSSKKAYIGNFGSYAGQANDGTKATPLPANAPAYGDSRGKTGNTTGRLMSNPALYPGAPDYRTPGTSELPTPGATQSIRTGLFTLPIIRASVTERNIRSNTKATGIEDANIPWVTRFNNYGNTALDTDGNSANGYQFVSNASTPSQGQLLSRGDFEAQIMHYRMRGADSTYLFQASAGSVVGYTRAQEQADMKYGWGSNPVVNGIFSRKVKGAYVHALATLDTVVGVSGNDSGDKNPTGLAQAGAVWSGVYDKARSDGPRRLAILLSNLNAGTKTIDLPNFIGGFETVGGAFAVGNDDYQLQAGTHRLVLFSLKDVDSSKKVKLKWVADSSTAVFEDNNRNGVGIPEPTSIALLGVGAVGLLARRRRRA